MEFLDMKNASERERKEIEDILSRGSHGVEFPSEFLAGTIESKGNLSEHVENENPDESDEKHELEENEIIENQELSMHAPPLATAYIPAAFIGSQPQSNVSNAMGTVYDPKRQALMTHDSYKGPYYTPGFAQVPIASKRENAMMSPESMKVPFYSSPHFAPVITSMSHVSVPSTATNIAGALSPSAVAVATSVGNPISIACNTEDSENRVPVSGASFPMPAAFTPHTYSPNPYVPSHGAPPLPLPTHMYPFYLPVQLQPQFYTPIPPPQLAQNHTSRHPVVARTVGYPQNGNIVIPVANLNGVNGGGGCAAVGAAADGEVVDVKDLPKCADEEASEEVPKENSEAGERTGESPAPESVDIEEAAGDAGHQSTQESETISRSNNDDPSTQCSKPENELDVNENVSAELVEPTDAVESCDSTVVASKEKAGVPLNTRSWADLFKDQDSLHSSSMYSNTSSYSSHNPVLSSQSYPDHEARLEHEAQPLSSATVNDKLVDAQVSSIPLQEDVLSKKLGRKLKEIHLKHSLPFLIPRGFVNRGNWCYINATLQALLYCPPFYNLMREIGELHGIHRDKSSTPIIDSFAKFFSNFLPSEPMMKKVKLGANFSGDDLPTGDPFEPKCIYDVLGLIKSECLKGKQEDAEEFLSSVLNGLHDEMVSLFKHIQSDKKDDSQATSNGHLNDDYYDDTKANDDDASLWKEVGPRHKALPTRSTKVVETPILDIFGGSILSIRTAGKDVCGNRQPFFTLQLDIQSEKIKSVEDALRVLTSSESIQGYTCPKTKQAVDASYQVFLNQLPPILILHLKIFGYDKDGGSRKLLKKIEYPIDLELPRESIHQERGVEKSKYSKAYKLLAVVHHDGNESVKGHYITDIFHIGSSLWLRCDDVSVKPITTQQLLNPQIPRVPYLLFYRRCDTLRGQNQIQRGAASH